jgi:spermidine/putrescine transport system substrate-binding protein
MKLRLLVALAILVPLLAACGGGSSTGGTTGGSTGGTTTEPQTLRLFTWTDYIDPDLVAEFEQEFNATVVIDLYDSNELMIPKIRTGTSNYDLVVPSDYAVQSMVKEGLLAPLDKAKLENLKHIDPTLLNLYFDPGNAYSVPYFWGVTGIAYNKTKLDSPPDSWSALFDPAVLQQYTENDIAFTMLDDQRETPAVALLLQGKTVNETDPTALATAQELLIAQKPFVSAYDSASVNLKLATEEIALAHAWSGAAAQALVGIEDKPGNPNIAFVIPKEGGVIWMDNFAVVEKSQNKDLAHAFINFMLRPEIAARNADYVLYLTPNKDAEALLAQETKDIYAAGFKPDAETMKRLQWLERNEQTDTAFSDLWTQVNGQ